MEFKNYEELSHLVEASGGVVTVDMGSLRDAHGAGKLGVNVVANISEELATKGLNHYPRPLPVNQWEKARIYRSGSDIARIITAALTVDDPNSDATLRKCASDNSLATLRRIRELVCG